MADAQLLLQRGAAQIEIAVLQTQILARLRFSFDLKGGVLERLSTTKRTAATSIWPVASLGLVVPSGRGRTVPSTPITVSARKAAAVDIVSASTVAGLKTIWVRP